MNYLKIGLTSLVALGNVCCFSASHSKEQPNEKNIEVVTSPPKDTRNPFYVTHQEPLLAQPLTKLPLGAIHPCGWLKHQLDLMADGLTGHLEEISPYLKPDNGWLNPDKSAWEAEPLWFSGFHDLAVLTGDNRLLKIKDKWLEAVLSSQDEDGYFGPKPLKNIKCENGQVISDIWPHMIMIDPLIRHYEYSNDERVIPLLLKFFRFCDKLPDESFLPESTKGNFGWGGEGITSFSRFVQYVRAGDLIPQIYWLYSQTKEEWLLEFAAKVFHKIRPPWDEWLDHHGGNFTKRFAYPTLFWPQSKLNYHKNASEYWYKQHMATWGQMPRGVFAADERIRPGAVDPRQGFETCGMIDFVRNFFLLAQITGDPTYGDRAEDIMLNHYPVTHTPDNKYICYLSACNQVSRDTTTYHISRNEAGYPLNNIVPDQNRTSRIAYTENNRCCGHNSGISWPNYIEHLFMATSDLGLANVVYGACQVDAKVGGQGRSVHVDCQTDYPFSSKIHLKLSMADNVHFPLYFRIPGWATATRISINGKQSNYGPAPTSYIKINRKWENDDVIDVEFSMELTTTEWPRNGSVTVNLGPLSYALKIDEKWEEVNTPMGYKHYWQVLPKSPWNYGLILDQDNPLKNFKIVKKDLGVLQPWTVDNAPIEIQCQAKRIPNWGLENMTVAELQPSPVRSTEPVESITLIPMGCARLRISCFPWIGEGVLARDWEKVPEHIDWRDVPKNRFDLMYPLNQKTQIPKKDTGVKVNNSKSKKFFDD